MATLHEYGVPKGRPMQSNDQFSMAKYRDLVKDPFFLRRPNMDIVLLQDGKDLREVCDSASKALSAEEEPLGTI